MIVEAFISSIEFVRINKDKCYFKVKLVDDNGNLIGYFGDSKINDNINFRKQLFGILAACDCFDLLKLSSDKPEFLSIYLEYDSFDRITSVINMDGNGLSCLDDGRYGVSKHDLEKLGGIENRGKILSISSRSGVFMIMVETRVFVTHYVTGSVYSGFGYPLDWNISKLEPHYINLSAMKFRTFIESILKIYKTNDLLLLGGSDIVNYPKVLIEVDPKGKVVAIGNDKNDYYLKKNGNSYEIVNGNLKVDIEENDNLSKSEGIITSLRRVLRKRK